MNEVTQILEAVERGDRQAARELLPLVYGELRRLAAVKLAQEKPGQTLQPTALVHEAYLRLVGPGNAEGFSSRRHFFAAAAEAMRRILVDQARRRLAVRRGGGFERVEENLDLLGRSPRDAELLAIHEALDQLAEQDALKADLVKLRYFAGYSNHEAAELLGLTDKSAEKHWVFARAWLRRFLGPDEVPEKIPEPRGRTA